jgi:curved DNA-binding protein
MNNYYNTLGLNTSATSDEIRRAYRILARRYHPDVNPGKDSNEKFKDIAEAYRILSDKKRREKYDLEYEQAEQKFQQSRYKAYTDKAREQFQAQSRAYANARRAQEANTSRSNNNSKKTSPSNTPPTKNASENLEHNSLSEKLQTIAKNFIHKPLPNPFSQFKQKKSSQRPKSISIIEVSITVPDAILGVRKSIEINENGHSRKISVKIPPGSLTGSVVRMRNKENALEELVLVVQVARHPFLSLEKKGLIVDLPITVHEAVCGANVIVPTLEDQLVLKIPENTQSGTLIRLQGKGIKRRDGVQGDLYYQVLIKIPESVGSPQLKDASEKLSTLYPGDIRATLPKTLITNS